VRALRAECACCSSQVLHHASTSWRHRALLRRDELDRNLGASLLFDARNAAFGRDAAWPSATHLRRPLRIQHELPVRSLSLEVFRVPAYR